MLTDFDQSFDQCIKQLTLPVNAVYRLGETFDQVDQDFDWPGKDSDRSGKLATLSKG